MPSSSGKKILHIVEAMGGGVFTYMVDLANALADRYEVFIAYAVRQQTPARYEAYFDKRIHLICVGCFERSINPVKDMGAFFEIRKIAGQIKPDIIHLHSSKAGALGRWAFNGRKTALFYTPHGYSFLMQDHSAVKKAIYKMVEMISAKRHCTTISCSEGEHQETLKLTRDAVYVSNGINLAEVQRVIDSKTPQPGGKTFTVFTLGRICGQKNPDLFNRVALAMPEVRFLWIGDGELRERLTAANIEITGWVEREEALRAAVQCDVFLLTSLWEGLPMSLLEAMYMKKCCVVNDVIGSRDVIRTGINGYVCHSVEEFAKSIEAARMDAVSALVSKAYEDILAEYNTAVMVERYAEIYDRSQRGPEETCGMCEVKER